MRYPGFRTQPDQQRERAEKKLHPDTDRAHGHPSVLVAEARGRGGVDIGNRHQHQEHDADLVHFAAVYLGGIAVAELMESLHDRIDEPEQ